MATRNRQCTRFGLLLTFALLVSSPAFADGLPTYTATNGFASFNFPNLLGGNGESSFSVTGPGIDASGDGVDPASTPPDAPSGTLQTVLLSFGFGYFGGAVASGTVYDDLLFGGAVVVSSNAPVIWPTGDATLNVPAVSSGGFTACTPSLDCSGFGGNPQQVFNLDWAVPGHLVVSFADDGCGCGFDLVTSATFTPTPEPTSIALVLPGVLVLMTEVLYRYRRVQLSRN